ncbi:MULTISPECIES: DUF4998 domain-containing protein [Sphingobacterium]|uniref:DUF4998 domain-containing protein n=1 Tax=Sphingobacterium populi TaxID=1812824 RepID=A0ABW5UF96_9SPHI|nr:DUF4998 domain-containing protein [Sphingobacterium sp. CFCC 11742]
MINKVLFFMAGVILSLYSCTKMDDYKKYFTDEEIIYIGKADSVQVISGRERVMLRWLIISDPKVSSALIFWNNRTQERKIDIQRGQGIDTIEVTIDRLEQGFHSFEIYTLDREGNKSVPVYASGMSYGDYYEASLPNRSVDGVKHQIGGDTFVDWLLADSTSIGVRLRYTDTEGRNRVVVVPNEQTMTALQQVDLAGSISYQTMYKPDSLAIDTFYAPIISLKANEILLKNSGSPFIGTDVAGRWGNLKDWNYNSAVQNHNGVGGFDNLNGSGYISFEYWGTPSITNGKIWQTLNLPAGDYRFVTTISNIDFTCEASYVAVANGQQLPNVEQMPSALGSYKLTDNQLNNREVTVHFSVNQVIMPVTLGFVSTMLNNNPTSLRIAKVRLFRD